MAVNCTNPKAVNYNPAATTDDGSCIYLVKLNDTCYAFQDLAVTEITDQSFTVSWSMRGNSWVFFHDYIADIYFSTRGKLYSAKNNSIYEHNTGAYGKYYDNTVNPFFIDIVFPVGSEETLDTLLWISEVLNSDGSYSQQETLTHITIWNSRQCTGRIPLQNIFSDLEYKTHRKTQGKWSFDDFRDKVKQEDTAFLQDLFHNFAIIDSALSDSLPWFEQQLLEDNYFIVRFEFDNISNKQFLLHQVGINADPSFR